MTDDFVTLLTTTDAMAVDVLEQMLQQEGLPHRVIGNRNAAAVGGAPHIFDIRVEVPRQLEDEALEVARRVFDPDPLGDLDRDDLPEELREPQEAAEASDTPPPGGARRLRPLFAAGVVLLFPGGCHLYARRPWTALLIAPAEVAAFFMLAMGSWTVWMSGGLLLGGLLASDLIGGQFAVRAYNRGERPVSGAQLLRGLAFLVLAGAFAAWIGPRIPFVPAETDTTDPRLIDDLYWPDSDSPHGATEGTGNGLIFRFDPIELPSRSQ